MEDLTAAVETLQDRLRRYPPERYPVQHATACFHLGAAYLRLARPSEAVAALEAAARGFPPERMPLEHGKTQNLLGAALREARQPAEAMSAFRRAVDSLGRVDDASEQAAAQFNLGLVLRDTGEAAAATELFAAALGTFRRSRRTAHVALAARELGSAEIEAGEPERAVPHLSAAVDAARRVGDRETLAAAGNALGLAYLATGEHRDAVAALEAALAAAPRATRPAGYAMTKANLARVHETTEDGPRARLAAAQALETPGAAAEVRAQAAEVLARWGEADRDLAVVLDEEPAERRPRVVRDELARWVDAPDTRRRAAAAGWVAAQLAPGAPAAERSDPWLTVLLELPADGLDAVVSAVVAALGERSAEDADRFRSATRRAVMAFPQPQARRLAAVFEHHAVAAGYGTGWQ